MYKAMYNYLFACLTIIFMSVTPINEIARIFPISLSR